jgi:hypothetical protein
LARANYNYPAENPETDLPFSVGDIVFVISQMKDGWWWGEIHGKFGRFPGSYVEILTPEETTAHMNDYNANVKAGKNEKAIVAEDGIISELQTQKDELLKNLEELSEKRRVIEANAAEALTELRAALTSYGSGLPAKLTELRSKLEEFKKQQVTLQATKSGLMHDLETFSQDLSCSATPSTQKKMVKVVEQPFFTSSIHLSSKKLTFFFFLLNRRTPRHQDWMTE